MDASEELRRWLLSFDGGEDDVHWPEPEFVRFVAYRVPAASVLWLNERWLFEHGIDALDEVSLERVKRRLLSNFACVVADSSVDTAHLDLGQPIELWADRYGETGGATHGGSGRAGTRGPFNAKGVGRTPLVSTDTDWYHSHGCMWLEEATREAIVGEILHVETPRGAVPVVAVIDLKIEAAWPHGSGTRRRAIAVRPNFLRPAHLQRSVFFGSSGFEGSDQHKDALRVERVAARAFGDGARPVVPPLASASLLESALRVTEAVAYSNFHRLWLGPYSSANITLDGQVVDFGAFNPVPSWRKFHGDALRPPLGNELGQIIGSFIVARRSLVKSGIRAPTVEKLTSAISWRFRRVFEEECARLQEATAAFDDASAGFLHRLLRDLYDQEQRELEYAPSRRESLVSLLPVPHGDSPAQATYRAISTKLDVDPDCQVSPLSLRQLSALCTLARIFEPRRLLYREVLEPRTERLLSSRLATRDDFPELVARFIATTVLKSRRTWRELPSGAIVLAQHSESLSHYAICIDSNSGRQFVWFDLFRWQGRTQFFGGTFVEDGEADLKSMTRWREAVSLEDSVNALELRDLEISWRGRTVTLPRPRYVYRHAAAIARQVAEGRSTTTPEGNGPHDSPFSSTLA